MSKKTEEKDNFGSIENLSGGLRSNSRGSLFSSSGVDDILDKLKVLGYQKDFCFANNFGPIHRYYFQTPDVNPNQQLYIFALLTVWLMGKVNIKVQKPGQFDDPNATCANIVSDLKKLGVPFEFGPTKLKQGYGEACIYVLQSLVDLAVSHLKISFGAPIHKIDDYPDEAEVDHAAEITTEKAEDIAANQDDEEEMYSNLPAYSSKKKEEATENLPSVPKVDPAEWRLEVERVAVQLKVKLPNDNKDWRLHLQQMDHHHEKISGGLSSTQEKLRKLHSEIDQVLEKITSREKYINAQFDGQIDQFKRLQDQSSSSKQKYTVASSNVTELTNELARISDELESVKSKMDDLGSGMTDSKPLLSIKQSSGKLKMMETPVTTEAVGNKKTVVVAEENKKSDDEQEEMSVDPLNYNTLLEELPDDEPQLDLINFRLRKVDFISRLKLLKRVCVRQNLITKIEGIEGLIHLEDLDLYDNRLTKIEGLNTLVNLKRLDLSFNKIKKIEGVDKLIKLKDLFFVSNKISKISGLDTLVNLTNLELGANRIRIIENLEKLVNLKQLWLGKNKITKIEGLEGQKDLELLSIQSNRISNLEGIKELPNLTELYCSHNLLDKIPVIENKKITTLDIGNNQIPKLEGLENLIILEELWASYNKFSSFEEVEIQLSKKEHLTTVYFEGNPIQTDGRPAYRIKLKTILPQITQIDANQTNLEDPCNLDNFPSLKALNPRLISKVPFQPSDAMVPSTNPSVSQFICKEPAIIATPKEFKSIVDSVRGAIEHGIHPLRISKGSSGSYFCRNMEGKIVGVFKPRCEEPYGDLNPKMVKFVHRNFFPCCFGRSCIIPNLGYVSEAAASYIDRRLGLGIVPVTEVVTLSSPAFHYSLKDRIQNRLLGTPLPEKTGSFQLFLDGYEDATSFFLKGTKIGAWAEESKKEFKYYFERLVILDYLIRNTDRGSDNWLIKTTLTTPLNSTSSTSTLEDPDSLFETSLQRHIFCMHIAGIDHGLAFPVSHPNRLRSYPYGWLELSIAKSSFSKNTADELLPFLTSQSWWDETLAGLQQLFRIDPDFHIDIFAKQKAVIRGQGYNLVDILFLSRICETTPFDLVQKPLVMIHEDEEDEDLNEDEIELLLQCDGSEHQPLSPARKFLLNQQRSLTRLLTSTDKRMGILTNKDKERILQFSKEKKNICLQFPDHLLSYSTAAVETMSLLCPESCFFVLADTTFGYCCVDKVAGEHGNSDGIIHFGPACLSKPSSSTPVLWIFERQPVDEALVAQSLQNLLDSDKNPLIIITDTCTYHCLVELKALFQNDERVIFSSIRDQHDPSSNEKVPAQSNDITYIQIQGRFFPIHSEEAMQSATLFFIGNANSLTFSNIMMRHNFKKVISFDPVSSNAQEHNGEANLMIRRRYIMVQKARDANTIGIVVGTLEIADYLNTINALKKLIIARGKKPYLLAVGKPNPAKLGNFLEIDAFCLIACPENSLLDSREFMTPIVTPYELLLALDLDSIWNMSSYELDLQNLMPRLLSQIDQENERLRQRMKNDVNDEETSDEEPHFSLISGGYAVNKHFISTRKTSVDTNSAASDALIQRSEGTMSQNVVRSAGAEFWKTRTFQGLELSTEVGHDFAQLEIGRKGIARGYEKET